MGKKNWLFVQVYSSWSAVQTVVAKQLFQRGQRICGVFPMLSKYTCFNLNGFTFCNINGVRILLQKHSVLMFRMF